MNNIKHLLHKYENQYGENKWVQGEHATPDYWNKERQKAETKNKHLILDTILNEYPFELNIAQIRTLHYWIDIFQPDWKSIHYNSSTETIILALIFIQYKRVNSNITPDEYSISKKYKLTSKKFSLIQNRIIFLLMKNTPLRYNVEDKYTQYINTKKEY